MISNQLPNWAEALTAVLATATLLAVVLAAFQIRHVNLQMHRELEMQYLLRFWTLMDRRSEKFKLKGVPKRADRILIQEYLGLCEDQIELRALGRVTDHTWDYWRRDMRTFCRDDVIQSEIRRTSQDDYPHLRKLLADAKSDPLEKNKFWRVTHGL